MLVENIKKLVLYGIKTEILPECEKVYATNMLLDLFREDTYEETEIESDTGTLELEEILTALLDAAIKRGLIEDGITEKDLFDAKIMNCILPRPAWIQQIFQEKYKESPLEATNYYYKLSGDSDYIRHYRTRKDKKWTLDCEYGKIDLTINLSKPEKDPKAIAAAKNIKSSSYPKCLLCKENEGYAGRMNHPGRVNHRIIPIIINNEEWGLQYSPYVYYNEHCIVFKGKHDPMMINKETFVKLFDFVDLFPHYFLGSNADLPIVGGSILSHDHFQGGHYTFAMENAKIEEYVTISGYEEIQAGIVHWPLSVLRLKGEDKEKVILLADIILQNWRAYTDEEAFIFAYTDGEPHNTITPIARKKGNAYELDLVLRNNITTKRHPLGVYHPHAQYHHIKKENIGLIEVMGLAVLPARLQEEMQALKEAILSGKNIREDSRIEKHAVWAEEFLSEYENITEETIQEILQKEIGKVFVKVLEDSGVYKCNTAGRKAFKKFLHSIKERK